jgi:peptidoglycan hydrolase-like protein with peptidoglycan-binding domain
MAINQDLQAIDTYMRTAKATNAAAVTLQEDWRVWFSNLNFWNLNIGIGSTLEAKRRRQAFNAANGTPEVQRGSVLTPEESNYFRNQMPRVDVTGMTKAEAAKAVWTVNPNAPPPPASLAKMFAATKPGTSRPTIRKGSKGKAGTPIGDAVIAWQTILGLKADGDFGTGTDTATRKWQRDHGLKDDGVVGGATWAKAIPVPPADTGLGIADAVARILGNVPESPVSATSAASITAAARPRPAPKPSQGTAQPTPAAGANVFASTANAMNGQNAPAPKVSPTVSEAGMFAGLDKLPRWAKIGGAIALGVAAVFGLKKQHEQNQMIAHLKDGERSARERRRYV